VAIRIGIDVGGTFTDYVAVSDNQTLVSGKTPSKPGNESVAVIEALRQVGQGLELDLSAVLRNTDVINFGTTVVTNALLEHKGAPTGMVTTKGFRDILELRRGYKESLFDIRMQPPQPIVPRKRRVGVTERIWGDGEVITPLDEGEVGAAANYFKQEGVKAVAVCFLQAPANPVHERRCAQLLAELLPHVFVTASCDVLSQIREFERFSTTVLNAYLSPIMRDYMNRLVGELRNEGFRGRFLVMQSNGGSRTAEESGKVGVGALLSGPAGGVVGGTDTGARSGFSNIIGADMGGTSYDVSLVRNGTPEVRNDAWVARQRVALPILDIHTIGAGGGSIAWVDSGNALRVGPESAGARPGPACYGLGGSYPTVTDADLVLGLLGSSHLLGGQVRLDRKRAEDAIKEHVGEPLGLSTTDAAIGVYRIANTNMSNGIRYVSVARGHDPRDFALMAFGGAAAAHAPMQARELGIRTILVPKTAGVLSAYGTLLADLKVSTATSFPAKVDNADLDLLNQIFDEQYKSEYQKVTGTDVVRVDRHVLVDLRYEGQANELTVEIPMADSSVTGHEWADAIRRFHQTHERLYTFSLPDKPVEVLTARQDIIGARVTHLPEVDTSHGREFDAHDAITSRRTAWLPNTETAFRPVELPVYAGTSVMPGCHIDGPAVIEESNTTILLLHGDQATLNAHNVYVISCGQGGL
jgi:N-methylhydantoinase A